MRVLVYGYVGSVLTIRAVGIGLVAGFTLGAGVGFSGELVSLFLFDAVMTVFTLRAPPVFTLGGLYIFECAFFSCLGVGSLSICWLR